MHAFQIECNSICQRREDGRMTRRLKRQLNVKLWRKQGFEGK